MKDKIIKLSLLLNNTKYYNDLIRLAELSNKEYGIINLDLTEMKSLVNADEIIFPNINIEHIGFELD